MVETVVKSSPYLLPTYQTNLNQAISTCITRLNEGHIVYSWFAIETLFIILPLDIKQTLKEEFEKIKNQISRSQTRTYSYDPLIRGANQTEALRDVLRVRNREFFEKIMFQLHDKGYLEKIAKQVPIGHE